MALNMARLRELIEAPHTCGDEWDSDAAWLVELDAFLEPVHAALPARFSTC